MTTVITLLAMLFCGIVAIPTLVFTVEVLLAVFFPARRLTVDEGHKPDCFVVLVPAHNEEANIVATVENLKSQMRPQDTLLVVADNCTDQTATLARVSGAVVLERSEPNLRGKGYALATGIDTLRLSPPATVIFIDADCRAGDGTLIRLAALSERYKRPVQSLNLMRAPRGLERRFAVAEFAWIVKNKVRPLGLIRLGLPCQLMGTGMAIPWSVVSQVNFASSNLVEDLELGIRLAHSGTPPLFSYHTLVESYFPKTEQGAVQQRRRWEQGSLMMLLRHAISSLWQGLRSRNYNLLAMALDMSVPPLILHGTVLALSVGILGVASPWTGTTPVATAAGLLVMFGGILTVAWLRFGTLALPPKHLVSIPMYLLQKVSIWWRHEREWKRADRS